VATVVIAMDIGGTRIVRPIRKEVFFGTHGKLAGAGGKHKVPLTPEGKHRKV